MAEDVPKLTITILLVLVVAISVLGTWVLLSEVSNIQPQVYLQGSTSDGGSGVTSFYKGQVPHESVSAQGKISLTIQEVEK